MSFTIKTEAKINGIPTDGLLCVAYAEARFPVDGNGNPIRPALGSPAPDSSPPDAGPIASSASFGGTGEVQITVPDAANYIIGCYQANSPWLIAWEGPKMATPHTSLQEVSGSVNRFGTLVTGRATTIAAGSNGAVLPQSVIDLVSTTGMPSSGTALINFSGTSYTAVAYTSVTGGGTPSLNGCTGGSGTLATGQLVVASAYQASTRRRLVNVTAWLVVGAVNNAQAEINLYSTTAGDFQNMGIAGLQTAATGTAVALTALTPTSMLVDPLGYYAVVASATGSGTSASILTWIENDL